MAKKKKRKHGGGRPAAYAQYQYQNPTTPAQRVYNEEIRKAYARVRGWEKKLSKEMGYEVKLDLIPKTPPTRATKYAVQMVKDITWQKIGKRLSRSMEIDEYLRKLVNDISDIGNHFGYSPRWGRKHGISRSDWMDIKKAFRDMMLADIEQAKDKYRDGRFYKRMMENNTGRELASVAWELYELPSDTPDLDHHNQLYMKYNRIITGQVMTDQEMREAQSAEEMSRLYQNAGGYNYG